MLSDKNRGKKNRLTKIMDNIYFKTKGLESEPNSEVVRMKTERL